MSHYGPEFFRRYADLLEGAGAYTLYADDLKVSTFADLESAKEHVSDSRRDDPKSRTIRWQVKDGSGKVVWDHDPMAESAGSYTLYANDLKVGTYKDLESAKEHVSDSRRDDPKSRTHRWQVKDTSGKVVWDHDPMAESAGQAQHGPEFFRRYSDILGEDAASDAKVIADAVYEIAEMGDMGDEGKEWLYGLADQPAPAGQIGAAWDDYMDSGANGEFEDYLTTKFDEQQLAMLAKVAPGLVDDARSELGGDDFF